MNADGIDDSHFQARDQAPAPAPALQASLEALLLAAGQPVTETALVDWLAEDFPGLDVATVQAGLDALDRRLDTHAGALELAWSASGVRLRIAARHGRLVARLWREKPPRLSRALLETLAVIAYRQPVTRSDIEDVRGVAVAAPLVRALEDRGWIETVGRREGPGRPQLFGTTRRLLDDLGLKSLDELPPLPEPGQGMAGELPEEANIATAPSPETSLSGSHDATASSRAGPGWEA